MGFQSENRRDLKPRPFFGGPVFLALEIRIRKQKKKKEEKKRKNNDKMTLSRTNGCTSFVQKVHKNVSVE